MNHLGDTNKMVRDTPRTDSLLTEILDAYGYVHQGNCPQRWVNHARELERELNAASVEIERLTAKVAQLYEGAEEQKQRIKRLEEFARTIENDFDHDEDAHRYGTTCRVCDAEDLLKETKVKEAKP